MFLDFKCFRNIFVCWIKKIKKKTINKLRFFRFIFYIGGILENNIIYYVMCVFKIFIFWKKVVDIHNNQHKIN
jgi:hypothetical protein